MSKFMPGDKVFPVSADRCNYVTEMAELVGKTLIVRSIIVDAKNEEVVEAGLPGEEWFWHPDDIRLVVDGESIPDLTNFGSIDYHTDQVAIRHATPEEIKASEKGKSRVKCRAEMCVKACEGFSDEELQNTNLFDEVLELRCEIIDLEKRRDVLKRQHAEMLRILEDLVSIEFAEIVNDDIKEVATAARNFVAQLSRQFDIGDIVTPVGVECYGYNAAMSHFFGKELVIHLIEYYDGQPDIIYAGLPGELAPAWYPINLRLVSKSKSK
jgi:hypothetical protein